MNYDELINFVANSLLKNSNDWNESSCTLNHKSGIELWTENFYLVDLNFYRPVKMKIKFKDRVYLHKIINQWRATKIGNVFIKESKPCQK